MALPANNPVQATTASIVNTVATDLLPAPGAGLFNYIKSLIITNASAVSTYVKIVDETSGAILTRIYAAAGQGANYFPRPWLKQLVSNKKVQVICETTAADITVSVTGFTAP